MLSFYHTLCGLEDAHDKVTQRPQGLAGYDRTLARRHQRTISGINHPRWNLAQCRRIILIADNLQHGQRLLPDSLLNANRQSEPRMPRITDYNFGTMGLLSCGCTTGSVPTAR